MVINSIQHAKNTLEVLLTFSENPVYQKVTCATKLLLIHKPWPFLIERAIKRIKAQGDVLFGVLCMARYTFPNFHKTLSIIIKIKRVFIYLLSFVAL